MFHQEFILVLASTLLLSVLALLGQKCGNIAESEVRHENIIS